MAGLGAEEGEVKAETADESVLQRAFPRAPDSVREIRAFVRALVDHREDGDEAVLLTSELAANAVRHGAGELRVSVRIGDVIRVEVGDDSPVLPERLAPDARAESGRGLQLVAALSASWGAERRGEGKVVWFTLPRGGAGS